MTVDFLYELFEIRPDMNFAANQARVPGKLFVSGEYAVLSLGQPAILFAVDQYLTCQVQLSRQPDAGVLRSNLEGLADYHYQSVTLTTDDGQEWRYVVAAIQIVHRLLAELGRPVQYYELTISSELVSQQGLKYGFGSSGAVTVATIKALLKFYGLVPHSPLVVYQLAAIAVLSLGSKGSLADLAVNAYGGWVYYIAPDRAWLSQRSSEMSLADLLRCQWPALKIEALTAPANLHVLVGWTGTPASTDVMIDRLATPHDAYYPQFLTQAKAIVDSMKQAFEAGDTLAIQSQVADYRHILLQLSKQYDLTIETPALTQLIELAQAYQYEAKSSGAGGGDCGFAIGQQHANQQHALHRAWHQAGISLLNVAVAPPLVEEDENEDASRNHGSTQS